MLPKVIYSVLALLVIAQSAVSDSEAKVKIDPSIIWPPIGSKCCNTHNIYAVDTSGSMYGLSWSKVLAYLAGVSGSSDYTSLFTHGGTWSGPPFQVTDYFSHVINAVIPPALPLPYGDTDYDDPLIRAIAILNQGFPEKTCISFFSDGWEEIYNLPQANIVQQFLTAKKNFQKKTGCPVCVKCYQTIKITGNSNFQSFCKQIGASVTELKAILDVDGPKFAELSLRAKKADPTDNGPKSDRNPN